MGQCCCELSLLRMSPETLHQAPAEQLALPRANLSLWDLASC